MTQKSIRPTWAEVNLSAVAHNVREICQVVAPSEYCVVVKGFGYGHGSIRITEAALRAGATSAAVALVEEGRELRKAGIDEQILVLSGPFVAAPEEVIRNELTPGVYTVDAIESIASAARKAGRKAFPVHVKVDTGMNRVGVPVQSAMQIIREVLKRPELQLEGVFTHFAGADELDRQYAKVQLERFNDILDELDRGKIDVPKVHASNSAAALLMPEARFDLVRVGLATYGIAPTQECESIVKLQPVMSLKSRVTYTKRVDEDEPVSYGMHYRTPSPTTLATIPIGYADGVVRQLGLNGASVLIRGQRHRIAGVVSMDQTVIDCGPSGDVQVGDEVVFLGRQDDEEISAWEWCEQLTGHIPYTVICGVSARVPRRYLPA